MCLQRHLPPYHIFDLRERVERTPGAFTLTPDGRADGWAEEQDRLGFLNMPYGRLICRRRCIP